MQRKNVRAGRRTKPKRKTSAKTKQHAVASSDSTSDHACTTTETTATIESKLVGQLGDDHQMNIVEVNEAALMAEVNAAVASAPVDPSQVDVQSDGTQAPVEQQATPEQVQQGYEVLFTGVVGWGSQTFAPNWAVTADETHKLSNALAGACMLWFPDQPIPPKYIAVLSVVAVAAEIVMSRRDPETGQLKPLNAKSTTKPAATPSNTGSPNKTEAV